MIITTVVSRVLQSLEFFRSGFGRWFVIIWQNSIFSKIFLIAFFVWGVIRSTMALFSSLCSYISGALSSLGFSGVRVGGVDILALANSVLPLDELMGYIVIWFTVYGVCAAIRFVRAAWSAIPFKAT